MTEQLNFIPMIIIVFFSMNKPLCKHKSNQCFYINIKNIGVKPPHYQLRKQSSRQIVMIFLISIKRNFSSKNSVRTDFLFLFRLNEVNKHFPVLMGSILQTISLELFPTFCKCLEKKQEQSLFDTFFLNIKSLVLDFFSSKSGLKNRHLILSNVCYRCDIEFVIKLVRTRGFHSPLFHVFQHFLNCKKQTNMKRSKRSEVAFIIIHRFPSLFSIFSNFPEFFVCNHNGNFNEKSMPIWLKCLDVFFEHWKKTDSFRNGFSIWVIFFNQHPKRLDIG